MSKAASILVVDDEVDICLALQEILSHDGHDVVAVESGEAALERAADQEFDLALIDLRLKGMSGMELLAALRESAPEMAVIILTAHGSLETAVEALRHGAHDYLFKPCKAPELRDSVRRGLMKRQIEQQRRHLLAQLEQNLRHSLHDLQANLGQGPAAIFPQPSAPAPGRELRQGGLVLDLDRHIVSLDDKPLELSPTEFEVLAYLVDQAPRVVSAPELIRNVQGYASELDEAREIVRYHVYRIRQKAEALTGRTNLIRTIRGVGYKVES